MGLNSFAGRSSTVSAIAVYPLQPNTSGDFDLVRSIQTYTVKQADNLHGAVDLWVDGQADVVYATSELSEMLFVYADVSLIPSGTQNVTSALKIAPLDASQQTFMFRGFERAVR